MNAVEVLIGGGALAVLVISGLVAKFKDAQADVEFLLADGLAQIDCAGWEAEMCSQSPLFDDDGWLR